MKKKLFNAAHSAYRFSNTWTGTIIIVLFVIFFVAQAFRIPSGSMKDSLLVGDHLFAKKFAYGISTPHIPFLEIPLIPGTDGHIIDGDEPKRGDIVIFRYPHNQKLHYVKRCVALPGDELYLEDKILYLHPREGNEYAKKAFSKYELVERDGKLWVKDPYTKEHPGIHHVDDYEVDSPVLIHMTFDGGVQTMPIGDVEYQKIKDGTYQLGEKTVLLDHNPIFNLAVTRVPENHFFMMGDNRDQSNDSRFWGAVPYGLIEGTPWFVYFSLNENYEVRWDRIGKTPNDLEEKTILDRAVKERTFTNSNEPNKLILE